MCWSRLVVFWVCVPKIFQIERTKKNQVAGINLWYVPFIILLWDINHSKCETSWRQLRFFFVNKKNLFFFYLKELIKIAVNIFLFLWVEFNFCYVYFRQSILLFFLSLFLFTIYMFSVWWSKKTEVLIMFFCFSCRYIYSPVYWDVNFCTKYLKV